MSVHRSLVIEAANARKCSVSHTDDILARHRCCRRATTLRDLTPARLEGAPDHTVSPTSDNVGFDWEAGLEVGPDVLGRDRFELRSSSPDSSE